jgi:hypothetical protein
MRSCCENCGEAVYDGRCVNCHEELYIQDQYFELNIPLPSKDSEFMKSVERHEKEVNQQNQR